MGIFLKKHESDAIIHHIRGYFNPISVNEKTEQKSAPFLYQIRTLRFLMRHSSHSPMAAPSAQRAMPASAAR